MDIMVEGESVLAHGGIQRLFSSVAERRMADVVDQRESFGEIHIKAEGSSYGAGHLGYFQRVRQTIAKMIRVTAGKELGLGFQAAEGTGGGHTIAIALEVIAGRVWGLGGGASPGWRYGKRGGGG